MFALFYHMFPPIGDEHVTAGDIGGVEVPGNNMDEEPRARGLNVDMSIDPTGLAFGEGIAEPVDAYKGRSSSGL